VSEAQHYVLEDQVGYKLRLAHQRHLEIFAEMMPDLTPTQFSTLLRLREQGAASQNHLGRLAAMDAATTKGVVDRLRDKGLVATARSQVDQRRLMVSLTADGAAALDRAVPVARAISARTTGALDAAELATLMGLLDRL